MDFSECVMAMAETDAKNYRHYKSNITTPACYHCTSFDKSKPKGHGNLSIKLTNELPWIMRTISKCSLSQTGRLAWNALSTILHELSTISSFKCHLLKAVLFSLAY